MDTLPGVLLLLQHEHVVVKELLKPFVGKVNAKLFKAVILEKHQKQFYKPNEAKDFHVILCTPLERLKEIYALKGNINVRNDPEFLGAPQRSKPGQLG